jgi:hypothetical protein
MKNLNSELVELSECQTKIRRKSDKPLPQLDDNYKHKLNERTVHLKGFPKDITLDEVMVWCKQYGTIDSVQMRRIPATNEFKGSIFVTYSQQSMADQLLNNGIVKYKDCNLLMENKVRYHERKVQFIKEKKRLRAQKRQRKEQQMVVDSKVQQKAKINETNAETVNPIEVESAVLKLNGLPRRLAYDKIKKYFSKYAKVVFVTKVNSKGDCFVRFGNKNDANNVLAVTKIQSEVQNCDKVIIEGKTATAEVLTGEEEKKFWIQNNKRFEKFQKIMKSKRIKKMDSQKQSNCKRTTSQASNSIEPKPLKA